MTHSQKHLLCVDDDWDACDACQSLAIIHSDLKFTFASDFDHGLTFIKRGVFDLYLLKSRLRDGFGIDLCREIRRKDPNGPVLVLIGEADDGDRRLIIEAGGSACLDKSEGFFRLDGIVRTLLRQAEYRSLNARSAELAAVRISIEERLFDVRRKNGIRLARADEHLLRAQAYSAFAGSGGARAHFERLWPSLLSNIAAEWKSSAG